MSETVGLCVAPNGKMSVHGDKDILQCLQSALLFKRDAGKDQRSYEVCRTENVVLSSASGAGSYVGDNERKNEIKSSKGKGKTAFFPFGFMYKKTVKKVFVKN